MTLLIGCSQAQTESETQTEFSSGTKQNFPSIEHDLEKNQTHLDAEIIEMQEEDSKYVIRFEAWLYGDKVEGEGYISEGLYKGVKKYHSNNSEEEITYDIIIDGDDSVILGIAPSTARHSQSTP